MRLLDVQTYGILSNLPDNDASEGGAWNLGAQRLPPYAILSHRWTGEEVSFQSFGHLSKDRLQHVPTENPVPRISPQQVQGDEASVFKIAGACRQVRKANDKENPHMRHIWIDTMCIDKSTGTQELTSAINSMFRWYQNAEVCYVYLFDMIWEPNNYEASQNQFIKSEYFSRGWTLQELLAPKRVEFYDRNWKYIGSRTSLVHGISQATGISADHLSGSYLSASLAQKMSWLARRTTTFPEDLVYCVLGIFGVYLEPRYGRGVEEFYRLQETIIQNWNEAIFDDSLFAWTEPSIRSSGLLAPSPACFRDAGNIIFDRTLARQRVDALFKGTGTGVSVHPNRRMTFRVEIFFPHVPAVNELTCGILALMLMPVTQAQKHAKRREVQLNCWAKGRDGSLRGKMIVMERNEDKTWRRTQCGKLLTSENLRVQSAHGYWSRFMLEMRIVNEAR